jgi:AraC-like DNA-binding protein
MTAIAATAPDPTIDSRRSQARPSLAGMKNGRSPFAERRKSKRQGRMPDFQSQTGGDVPGVPTREQTIGETGHALPLYPIGPQLLTGIPSRGGLPPRVLRRVREYIAAHLQQNISIQMLADVAGLSMFHFARTFKQSEGVTPHRFLLQSRLRRVQELLANTELPLSQIAIAAGFSDQSHCARRFREFVGITPRRYRWSTR